MPLIIKPNWPKQVPFIGIYDPSYPKSHGINYTDRTEWRREERRNGWSPSLHLVIGDSCKDGEVCRDDHVQ